MREQVDGRPAGGAVIQREGVETGRREQKLVLEGSARQQKGITSK